MNAGKLKQALADVPDDTEIVVPATDHHYRVVEAAVLVTVNRGKGGERGEWWEYWGEENQYPGTESDVVKAVVIE